MRVAEAGALRSGHHQLCRVGSTGLTPRKDIAAGQSPVLSWAPRCHGSGASEILWVAEEPGRKGPWLQDSPAFAAMAPPEPPILSRNTIFPESFS